MLAVGWRLLVTDHTAPWGVRFPQGSYAYQTHSTQYADFPHDAACSFPVHPTQLYSVAGLLLLFGILLLLRKKWNPFEGFVMPAYAVLYGVLRFIIEFYRGDGNPTGLSVRVQRFIIGLFQGDGDSSVSSVGVLSNQQVFCLGMIAGGIALFWYLRRQALKNPPATPASPSA